MTVKPDLLLDCKGFHWDDCLVISVQCSVKKVLSTEGICFLTGEVHKRDAFRQARDFVKRANQSRDNTKVIVIGKNVVLVLCRTPTNYDISQ